MWTFCRFNRASTAVCRLESWRQQPLFARVTHSLRFIDVFAVAVPSFLTVADRSASHPQPLAAFASLACSSSSPSLSFSLSAHSICCLCIASSSFARAAATSASLLCPPSPSSFFTALSLLAVDAAGVPALRVFACTSLATDLEDCLPKEVGRKEASSD